MGTKMLLDGEINKRYLRLKTQHMLNYHQNVTCQEKIQFHFVNQED